LGDDIDIQASFEVTGNHNSRQTAKAEVVHFYCGPTLVASAQNGVKTHFSTTHLPDGNHTMMANLFLFPDVIDTHDMGKLSPEENPEPQFQSFYVSEAIQVVSGNLIEVPLGELTLNLSYLDDDLQTVSFWASDDGGQSFNLIAELSGEQGKTSYTFSNNVLIKDQGFDDIGLGEERIFNLQQQGHVAFNDQNYLFIDLKKGSRATSYPVSFSRSGPDMTASGNEHYRSSTLVMRQIKKTTFTMGSPQGELGRWEDSSESQHEVSFEADFYMGVFEVTQAQWSLVMGSTAKAPTTSEFKPVEGVTWEDLRGQGQLYDHPNAPEDVDPDSFFGRLRSKTKYAFDLPPKPSGSSPVAQERTQPSIAAST
jgi:hypothetical protein